jgi:hypothetical protein
MAGWDAFLSYRRADVGVARAIHRLLGAFGQNVFLDVANIPLGQPWEATIDQAMSTSRTLVILWSRNAANSSEMRREWGARPADCRMIPVRLDGSPLPAELAHLQALEGLSVAERILARGAELVKHQHLSHAKANATILSELREEGVDLTPEQERAVLGYVGSMGRALMAAAAVFLTWFFARNAAAAIIAPASVVAAAGFAAGWYSKAPTVVETPRHDDASMQINSDLRACTSKAEACGAELDRCRARPPEPPARDCPNPTKAEEAPRTQLPADKRKKVLPKPSPATSAGDPNGHAMLPSDAYPTATVPVSSLPVSALPTAIAPATDVPE